MWKQSQISNKYPTYRDILLKSAQSWLDGRRLDDNAEGLWRIHDSIYDFTDFIKHHPGGPDWLHLTKGTDITELFEVHHISDKPQLLLEKFKIRDAKDPRNITLTLKKDGFYMTLKSRVRDRIKTIDLKKCGDKSDLIHSTLLFISYFLCVLSGHYQSIILAALAGVVVNWTVISAHNYLHRKDNWRMYTYNLALMNYKEWRISHAMSHHMYPNSFHDLEISLFEPFFCWIPNPHIKNWIQRYGSWIYFPLIYAFLSITQYVSRLIISIVKGNNFMEWSDLVPFTIPIAMILTTGIGIWNVLKIWAIILLSAGFMFSLIAINAGHHHPEITHDGDMLREDRDWGLFQLDAIIDRADLKKSQFLVLTHFGEHTMHHMFPTLDHGVLPHLYSVMYETMADFKGQLRECDFVPHVIGQFNQLARVIPNKKPPREWL